MNKNRNDANKIQRSSLPLLPQDQIREGEDVIGECHSERLGCKALY